MKISCITSDWLHLEELTELQGNLKERTKKDIQKIITSINKFGFATPFFVWKHDGINHVLDGHGRLTALKYMKSQGEIIPELPVVYVDCKDEDTAKQLLLRITSQYGEMTAESVMEFMQGIDLEIEEVALPCGTLDLHIDTEEETEGDDEVPEMQEESVSKPGEIYELGDSLLMCGDSTKEEDVERLMGGIEADLLVTDPPYNVALGYETEEQAKARNRRTDGLKIQNDRMTDLEFRDFLINVFRIGMSNIKAGATYYVWYSDNESYNFIGALKDNNIEVRQILIWEKQALILGRQDYQYLHEPCLYGWNNGGSHSWYSDRKQTTILKFNRPTKSALHPTMKPVELIEYQIKNSSKAGDIVLDLFGGSGTTLIAAEKNNRKARLMELDPHYCDVIRRRYTQWAKENNRPLTSGCLE